MGINSRCFFGLRCSIKSADEKCQSENLEPLLFHIGADICASKCAGAVDQLDHDVRLWTNRDMHQRLGICQRLMKRSHQTV